MKKVESVDIACWLLASTAIAVVLITAPSRVKSEALPATIDFVWSPTENRAVFTIADDKQSDSDCPTALFEIDLVGPTVDRLLRAHSSATVPEDDMSCFYDPKYSADGQFVYFVTPAWPTSGAIQAYDRQSSNVKFIIDGGPYLVVGSGPLAGDLLVLRRKYPDNIGAGAYEEIDIVDPGSGHVIVATEPLRGLLRAAHGLRELKMMIERQEGWRVW